MAWARLACFGESVPFCKGGGVEAEGSCRSLGRTARRRMAIRISQIWLLLRLAPSMSLSHQPRMWGRGLESSMRTWGLESLCVQEAVWRQEIRRPPTYATTLYPV